MNKTFEGINWNSIQNMVDKLTWDKLNVQHWLPERIPVAEDIQDWKKLSNEEQTLFNRVFGGLTLLDTLQSETGMYSIMKDARTKHEEAVYTQIQYMESVHAKSYSTIFSTLCTPSEIDEIFNWVKTNKYLQYKANKINDVYENEPIIKRKAASVLLESFLFYSGFFTPLRYMGESKMMKAGEIISLINN